MNDFNFYRKTIQPVPQDTDRPLWSVMIPTYNCASYLRETLASVLAQDPGSEIMQIEVVDDCSTKDDPKAVVEELGRGRVGFYQQPQNVGFIKNFETCLQRSRGHLIHQLHGDDGVRQGFYQKMQHLFEQNSNIGAAFCRSIYMNEQGHWQNIHSLEQNESGILTNWLETIAAGQRIATPSIVVRREVYEQLGGFDRRIVCCGEDWEMWVRIAAQYPVAYETEPLALYRFKPLDSLTTTRIHQISQDMQMATEIIQSYLPQYLPPTTVNAVLTQAKNMYARWMLQPARQRMLQGDIPGGFTLLRDAINSQKSVALAKEIGQLLLQVGRSQIKHAATSLIRFPVKP